MTKAVFVEGEDALCSAIADALIAHSGVAAEIQQRIVAGGADPPEENFGDEQCCSKCNASANGRGRGPSTLRSDAAQLVASSGRQPKTIDATGRERGRGMGACGPCRVLKVCHR